MTDQTTEQCSECDGLFPPAEVTSGKCTACAAMVQCQKCAEFWDPHNMVGDYCYRCEEELEGHRGGFDWDEAAQHQDRLCKECGVNDVYTDDLCHGCSEQRNF